MNYHNFCKFDFWIENASTEFPRIMETNFPRIKRALFEKKKNYILVFNSHQGTFPDNTSYVGEVRDGYRFSSMWSVPCKFSELSRSLWHLFAIETGGNRWALSNVIHEERLLPHISLGASNQFDTSSTLDVFSTDDNLTFRCWLIENSFFFQFIYLIYSFYICNNSCLL